jgi:hemolysin activation/secretion protein
MNKIQFLSAAALLGACVVSSAQVAPPDAGKVLSGNTPVAPKAPADSKVPKVGLPVEPKAEQDAGPKALVKAVTITGNTIFGTSELEALVQDQLGQSHSLAGMRGIARRIGEFYRSKGYPFARALIPAQDFKSGTLAIVVVEGKYGTVNPTGEKDIVEGAKPFLSSLASGDVIEATRLEHVLLVLDDIPGIAVVPTVSPGKAAGTGDLTVKTVLEEPTGGDFGVDNHGSRYTGEYRAHLNWFRNTGLTFGDRLALSALVTDEAMWFGSADYELPLDGSGLRAQVGYSHTSYELGKDFASLGASGLAKIWSAKLSYPLIRSQMFNLQASVGFQHKTLQDDFASTSTSEHKFSQVFPVSLRFDQRDGLLGGAITYGQLTAAFGNLHLDSALYATDLTTAQKAGSFAKLNLDVARIQKLGAGFSAYVRGSFQWADDNLDSSERLGLGGAEGVRAYPLGEGSGDQGWLAQAELRYDAGSFAPFVFFDAGSADLNRHPWDVASDKTRTISGVGLGVRATYEKWNAELTVASPTTGGAPQSDSKDPSVRVYFSATRSF